MSFWPSLSPAHHRTIPRLDPEPSDNTELSSKTAMPSAYLTIAFGSPVAHQKLIDAHQAVKTWLDHNHTAYGLPASVAELDDIGRETLISRYTSENVSHQFPGQLRRILIVALD